VEDVSRNRLMAYTAAFRFFCPGHSGLTRFAALAFGCAAWTARHAATVVLCIDFGNGN
jgi:hypothetical protein